MLDVARHFMPADFVLRFLDVLAAHRLNVLHLHLTDDQGWRVPVARYPRLTEISGAHYTRDELARIVARAAELDITVVPEIEMPGHAQAALAAYPELGNHPERPLPLWDRWGINEHVFNLEESTITFLQHVLDEVMELFPGPYIHLGGDEVPTKEWEETAQRRLRELGLGSPVEACSWFVGRLAAHVARQGRQAIYWDEPNCPQVPGAKVMVWRAEHTNRTGPDIILAPHTRTYLDYYPSADPGQPPAQPGVLTLEEVYSFDPDPAVLGVQAQLWTEYMPTPADVERMAFPRLCAFAEVAWGSARDYADFLVRLAGHACHTPHLEQK